MSPWALLAAVLSAIAIAGGSYWQGRQDGRDAELAEAVRDEQVASIASEAAASAIAAAIPKITVRHQTVRQELEREIQTRDVYRNVACDTGPDSLQRFNATIPGAVASAPPRHSAVPASGAGD